MNLKQLSNLGSGVIFPIKLSTPVDENGNPEMVSTVVDGEIVEVPKVGWYPETSTELVKNNLTSLLIYHIGERFRQEEFGSRLWECLEEPNTQLLTYMATKFVKDSISFWESRITKISVETLKEDTKLYLKIHCTVDNEITESLIEYDHSTNMSYAY